MAPLTSVLTDSPLAYWLMEEPSGAVMIDSSGNGHNGSYGGSPTLGVSGPESRAAVAFNGGTQWAEAAIDLSPFSAITFECWFWWDSFADDNDFLVEYTPDSNSNNGFFVDPNYSTTSSFLASVTEGSSKLGHVTMSRPTAQEWHHLVVTINRSLAGDECNLFIDNISPSVDRPVNNDPGGSFTNSILYLASRAGSALFGNCRLAHVAIYSGTLSPARISAHYNEMVGGFVVAPNAISSSFAMGAPSLVSQSLITLQGISPEIIMGIPLLAAQFRIIPQGISSVFSSGFFAISTSNLISMSSIASFEQIGQIQLLNLNRLIFNGIGSVEVFGIPALTTIALPRTIVLIGRSSEFQVGLPGLIESICRAISQRIIFNAEEVGGPMTLYAGERGRILHFATGDSDPITPEDVSTCLISIYNVAGELVLLETSMAWDAVYSRWSYVWDTTDLDSGSYRVKVRLVGLDGGSVWEYKRVRLARNPVGV